MGFKLGTPLGDSFWGVKNSLQNPPNNYSEQEAYTRATAFVLQESGVILLKSDASTMNFKKIDVTIDSIDTNGYFIYNNIDCN